MGARHRYDTDAGGVKRCAKCGACTAVCPVYRASGKEIYSARGKRHLAEVYGGKRPTPVFEDIYSKCLLCGACTAACPRQLDITADVVAARSGFSAFYGEHGYQKFLARQALKRPELLGGARVLGRRAAEILFARLPADSGLRLRLALFAEQPVVPRPDVPAFPRTVGGEGSGNGVTYFPGCAARYLYPEVMEAVAEVLAGCGCELQIPEGLGCCGLAARAAGHLEEAKRLARRTIRRLELGDGPILVSCGSCFAQVAGYGELFEDDPDWHERAALVGERAVEIGAMLQSLVAEETGETAAAPAIRVFYHDPCHLRHDAGITAEPRSVLRSLPGVELLELPDGPQCCGQGGLFHIGAPELSAAIRDDLADKILSLEPDMITTTCSGCLMQLRSAMAARQAAVPVVHLAAFVKARQSGGARNERP